MSEVTGILDRLREGDSAAFEELVPLVYQELRLKARQYLARQPANHTLQPTALVHEAFLKLVGRDSDWRSRRHFYNAAAEVMRQILVSHARAKTARKRGGGLAGAAARRQRMDLDQIPAPGAVEDLDCEALDRALTELRQRDERRYRVVMLRYFAGLSDAEVARALELSEKTVERDWSTAKAFLRARMAAANAG
jgi:RNA polymerase sigma factor (TIGR02999 family)